MSDVAFEGTAIADPAAPDQMLTDPMRFHVRKYLKGSGPAIASVYGGPERVGRNSFRMQSTMIEPLPAQRWIIYAANLDEKLTTSECAGSRLIAAAPRAAAVSPARGSGAYALAGLAGLAAIMGTAFFVGRGLRSPRP